MLGTALRVLTSSVVKLAAVDGKGLARGLAGVTALLTEMVAVTRGMAGQAKGMAAAGAGMILLAIGIRILVSSVVTLDKLSWKDMSQGIAGVAMLLTAMCTVLCFL